MTGRDRIVMLVVVCVAALAGFWFLAFSPKRNEAASLQNQVSSAQQRLDAANSEIAQSRNAQVTYQAATATLAYLGKAVPADDQVPSLIYELNSAAHSNGVSFDRFQSGGAAASGSSAGPASLALSGLQTMPFSFTFEGNFFHLEGFFRAIDQLIVPDQQQITANGRLLTLDSVSLAPGAGGFPNIQATVQATGFELPLQSSSANTPPPVLGLPSLHGGTQTPSGGSGTGGSLPDLPTAAATGAVP
jgi:Tfp pilus assembly protein PilO